MTGPIVYQFLGQPIDNAKIRDQAVAWLREQLRLTRDSVISNPAELLRTLSDLQAMKFPNPNEGMLL